MARSAAEAAELVTITIRLRADDVERARKRARVMAIPYQHVIRQWVADAAKASEGAEGDA
jgi:predicted DNA binding CopG/RHH family protein